MLTNHYQWEGIFLSGKATNGIIYANSVENAKAELRKQGIIVQKIVRKCSFLLTRNVKPSDINLFVRQLATLINAGIPLSSGFDIIKSGVSNPRMKALIHLIQTDVKGGLMFAQALRRHPVFFNHLFCCMVNAGEQSGTLDQLLLTVAEYKEKMTGIKNRITKAMAYPIAVTLIGTMVTGGLLAYVVPQFDSLFKSFGAELPILTKYVINLSVFFKTWWILIGFITATTIFGAIYAHKHLPEFSKMNQRLMLRLPIIGGIVQKSSIARFTRTLSITFAAGLPLTEALKSVGEVTGIGLYVQAASKVREEISQGESMRNAIQNTGLFPEMVIHLISIGEESGTLEQMLRKIADVYEEEVDTAIDVLSGLLEPAIMTILGLLIGALVVAMYLPILKLGSIV